MDFIIFISVSLIFGLPSEIICVGYRSACPRRKIHVTGVPGKLHQDIENYEDASQMLEHVAQALKQTSREATILLYTSALDSHLQKMAELADSHVPLPVALAKRDQVS